MAGCCEHGNEPLGYIEVWSFLASLPASFVRGFLHVELGDLYKARGIHFSMLHGETYRLFWNHFVQSDLQR